ncbi:S66 family peptidase [Streptococcus dysgalactiae]|uniref:S66 family peptidase n=1 Tax=Streptococcus dysgalactiae TaxID=1334 RepID=UPI003D73722B
MKKLNKPKTLKSGDRIAFVSLSSGIAGDDNVIWRIEVAKARLQHMGFDVIVMPNALKGSKFVYENPKLRAKDLMDAFSDISVKAIFTTTGGNDSIRLLPFIDFEVIKNNPKIFTGFSDSTIAHLLCFKGNLSSFYGISILHDLAENVQIPPYTMNAFHKSFCCTDKIGQLFPPEFIIEHGLRWDEDKKDFQRPSILNAGYEFLGSKKKVSGRLIGGCLEVLNIAKGTDIFPDITDFKNSILFLETSGTLSPPWLFEDSIRSFGAMGILNLINGIVFGRPFSCKFYSEYKDILLKVFKEYHCDIPIVYNFPIGHNEPKTILPIGSMMQIDPIANKVEILESGVE